MRFVVYNWFATNSKGEKPDIERAVLPTILYAKKEDGIATATAISVGWWRWGVGLIRTVIDNDR